MAENTNLMMLLLPAILTSVSGLLGVAIGFGLSIKAFTRQEKIKKEMAQTELMRSLLMEAQTNMNRCNDISNSLPATAFLETVIWDRVRYSDCLYFCITTRDISIYHQLLRAYGEILAVNFGIAQYHSALDGNRRCPTPDNANSVNNTLNTMRGVASSISPTLQTLEDSLKSFLIREKFFGK